jgi:uncharacterized membrane protein
MFDGLIVLLAIVAGFVGGHLLLSHALRARTVSIFGQGGFQAIYSLFSFLFLFLTLIAYHRALHAPLLWSPENLLVQLVFSVASCFAAALFVASLFGNPALIGANITDLSTRPPSGVFLITRHPMMFAIAIGSLAQILIAPTARNLIAFGGFAVLALVGSHLQDGKKIAQSGREWTMWVSRTPFWPDLRRLGKLGPAWLAGVLVWVLVCWLESRTTIAPVGLWYFIPSLPY